MAHPFRFGVQFSRLSGDDWHDRVRAVESLGYEAIYFPDHFDRQWEPVAGIAAVAAATQRVRVGSLVFDVDYRHPVVLAKASATIQLLSGGRHVFGIGAGWMESDYREAGMSYDRPGIRISRLEEALQIIRGMWTQERTSFSGEHYQVTEIAQAADLPPSGPPRLLIGGGGKRVLGLAGRHSDIVGINPKLEEGRITRTTAADLAPERVREKIAWLRAGAEAAGRDPEVLELQALVFVVAITDDPSGIRAGIASNTGMSVDEVADAPIFLTGSPTEICERLERRREEFGIHEIVIQGRDPAVLEQFAEGVVARLAGK